MEDKIRKSLDEVIDIELRSLEDKTGEAKQQSLKLLSELYKLRIEEKKIAQGNADAITKAKSQNLDRMLNIGTTVGVALLNVVALGVAVSTSMRYDQSGALPSYMSKNLLTKLLPRR